MRSLRLGLVVCCLVVGGGALASSNADAGTRYVSTFGSDANRCTSARPCRSFDRAYRVARPGDVVVVRGSRYGSQTINVHAAKAGARRRVVFRPAKGARIVLDYLTVYGKHVEFRSMTTDGWYAKPGAHDVVFRRIRATAQIFITSASRIWVLGGSVGPGADGAPQIKACTGCRTPPRRIVFRGVRFHDWVRRTPGAHADCLHIMTVDGLRIMNSRFRNCEHFSILFTVYGDAGNPRNVLIQNNFMDCCRSGYYSLFLGGGHGEVWRNFLIRNNSTNKAMAVADDSQVAGNIRFLSNIAPAILNCQRRGVSGNYNVLQRRDRCGSRDRFAASGFMNTHALDFRLKRWAAAINHGHPTNYPRADIFGHRRPRGRAPDAGAHEAR
jgi:hypothetical protein